MLDVPAQRPALSTHFSEGFIPEIHQSTGSVNGEPGTRDETSPCENDSHDRITNRNVCCLDMEQLSTCNERGLFYMLPH